MFFIIIILNLSPSFTLLPYLPRTLLHPLSLLHCCFLLGGLLFSSPAIAKEKLLHVVSTYFEDSLFSPPLLYSTTLLFLLSTTLLFLLSILFLLLSTTLLFLLSTTLLLLLSTTLLHYPTLSPLHYSTPLPYSFSSPLLYSFSSQSYSYSYIVPFFVSFRNIFWKRRKN